MFIRTLKNSIAVCFCIAMMICTGYAETVTTYVTVDENTVVKPSQKSMIGMGDTWDSWRMYLGNETSTETSKQYLDMINGYKIPINQQRMSGADSHDFFWKDTLGSMDKRGDGSPFSRNFGLVEWIKSVKAVNEEADFTFAVNVIYDSVENNADLVRFLTLMPDHPNAVGSDGINWAQKRIDLGITEPVNIKLFELGNEVYNIYCPISDDHTVTSQEAEECADKYIADCKENINAMKAVNPDIVFAMCGYSSGNGGKTAAVSWNKRILEMLNDDCDYIVDHKYYHDYSYWDIHEQIKARFIEPMDELGISAEDRPKLYYSEYGCWVEGVSEENSMSYLPWATSLRGALADARFLNGLLINCPYVDMATLFCSSGAAINTAEQWGAGFSIFRIFDDGKVYATSPAEMLKIFNEAVGDGNVGENVVKTTLSVNTSDGVREHSYFSGWNNYPYKDEKNPYGNAETPAGVLTVSSHTTAEGGLNLILVNSHNTVGHNMVPVFKNSYKLKEELILTSDSLTDNNIPITPDKVYTKRNLINSADKFGNYYVKPKSIIVLKLVPMNYEYAEKNDMIVNFINQSGYEGDVPAVGVGKFGLNCEMYNNGSMADVDHAVLLIPKQGVAVTDVINNLENSFDKLCYIGQSDVKRNMAYFNINLGNEPEGTYQAIVGNFVDENYKILDFYYRGSGKTKAIEDIAFKNEVSVDGNSLISNPEYLVKTQIKFNSEFDKDEPCKVTVLRGTPSEIVDREVVNTGYINALPNQAVSYNFYMPTDALNGNYTMRIEFVEHNGEKKVVNKEFNFNKPNEQLSLVAMPKNQEGSEITRENILQTQKIKLQVKDNNLLETAPEFKAITAFYGKNKQLIYAKMSDEITVVKGESVNVEILLSDISGLTDVDYIAVYLFGKDVKPYSNVYYIK